MTTKFFWDCSCVKHYIHNNGLPVCPVCGDSREDSPDARIDEVVKSGLATMEEIMRLEAPASRG